MYLISGQPGTGDIWHVVCLHVFCKLYLHNQSVIHLPLRLIFIISQNEGQLSLKPGNHYDLFTHVYESLDISGSQRIHYLRFSINMPLPLEKDIELQKWVRLEPIKAILKLTT